MRGNPETSYEAVFEAVAKLDDGFFRELEKQKGGTLGRYRTVVSKVG